MKSINLRAFSISNPDIDKSESDIYTRLCQKLNESKSVNSRRMPLNVSDPNNEEDLISYFSEVSKSPMFCTMLRIAPGNNVQHISEILLDKERFTMDDLDNTVLDTLAIYKNHYYFSVSNNFIITNLPGNTTVTRLQTYLNWLLDSLYEITPMIEESKLSDLANIQHITIKDSDVYPNTTKGSSDNMPNSKTSIFELGKMALATVKDMLTDTQNLNDAELAQMISAKLVIQFEKPKKSDSDELKKAYGALLKPVADLKNLSIKTRDNKTIMTGKDLERTKRVNIDTTDIGNINEQTLAQEMARFILELENEKKAGN